MTWGRTGWRARWPAERLHQLVPPQITGTFPALRGAAGRPHNLPRPLTGLVGREREAADVQRLLAENPLVTLAGPGGAGKTRLALRVAADVLADAAGQAGLPAGTLRPLPDGRDGAWFVDLAPLADGALVPQAVAAAVGVREVPGQPLAGVLAGALRERALLLVLDNCEHLLDACALLVETLLRAGPRLRVLATSREPLRAAGEAVYRVPPLAVPAAPRPPPRQRRPRRPQCPSWWPATRRCACSWSGPAPCARTSPSPRRTPRPSRTSAGSWTGCPWPSSSPPPAPAS